MPSCSDSAILRAPRPVLCEASLPRTSTTRPQSHFWFLLEPSTPSSKSAVSTGALLDGVRVRVAQLSAPLFAWSKLWLYNSQTKSHHLSVGIVFCGP